MFFVYSHYLFVSLPMNCRLTTPATVADLWVCTSIKAIMISVTSWLTSMLTNRRWYLSSMPCSTRRTDIAALHAAAASASRWRQRCYVPTTTSRATHVSCFVDWKLKGTRRSGLFWTSTMSSASTWPTSPRNTEERGTLWNSFSMKSWMRCWRYSLR